MKQYRLKYTSWLKYIISQRVRITLISFQLFLKFIYLQQLIKRMSQQNTTDASHTYIIPFPLQSLPFFSVSQHLYPPHNENFYNLSFLPTFYSSPSYLLPPLGKIPSQEIKPQILTQLGVAECVQGEKREKKGEISFKKNKKKYIEEVLSCNCSKSGCLKQYCRCYRNNRVCNDTCNCLQCRNFEKQAFALRKKQRGKHSKCNCKKTRCSSKYCDCLAAGGRCGEDCSCINCENQ